MFYPDRPVESIAHRDHFMAAYRVGRSDEQVLSAIHDNAEYPSTFALSDGPNELRVVPTLFDNSMGTDEKIAAIASRQLGLFTRKQAEEAGAGRGLIEHRLRTRRWERVHRGVFRIKGTPRTWEQEVLAACLAAGEGAVASYFTATSIWELTDRPTRIEISVPATRRLEPNGFIVHYVRLSRDDVTKRGVIPITSPFRSLLDLAGSASDPTIAERAFDNALRKGLVTLPRLVCQVAALEGSTVPGLALVRRLLESRIDLGIPESDLETIFVSLLDQFGLPQPQRQIRIVDEGADISRVDFLYPEHKVLIECDGHTTHSTPTDWERDLERNNTYTLAGLKVLRFPSKAVLLRGRKVCEDIARGLGTKLKV